MMRIFSTKQFSKNPLVQKIINMTTQTDEKIARVSEILEQIDKIVEKSTPANLHKI